MAHRQPVTGEQLAYVPPGGARDAMPRAPDPLVETPQRRALRARARPTPAAPGGKPARRSGNAQGWYGQTNVLQLANCVRALSPMNSVADQMSPVGSANEAL